MVLDILQKGLSLVWTEDNQLYDNFMAWRKRLEMLISGVALKKEPQEFICHCIKAWLGKMGHIHIKSAGLTGDDANSTECLLDALKGHCKSKSMK